MYLLIQIFLSFHIEYLAAGARQDLPNGNERARLEYLATRLILYYLAGIEMLIVNS